MVTEVNYLGGCYGFCSNTMYDEFVVRMQDNHFNSLSCLQFGNLFSVNSFNLPPSHVT